MATTPSTIAPTFVATVSAGNADEAAAKVERYIARCPGFSTTGRVSERSARHLLWNVEVANEGGDVNDLWVVLTSYGITPSDALGSTWQQVAGVGKF